MASVVLGLALSVPFAYLVLASIGPLVDQAVGSLFTWYHVHPYRFAGLANYRWVLDNSGARAAGARTAIYVAITVPIELLLGIGGAWLVLRVRRGRGLFVALSILPLVIPWSTSAQLFGGFFGLGGVLQGILKHVFGSSVPLILGAHPTFAFAVIVAIGIWKGAPWCFLFMLAAFDACPSDMFEAGRVDGGRGWAYWRHVVLPGVWPMLVFVAVFRLFAEAQMAQSVDLLTQGGPFGATELVGNYVNDLAFTSLQFPSSEALATLTGGVLLFSGLIGLLLLRRPAMPFTGSLRRTESPGGGRGKLTWRSKQSTDSDPVRWRPRSHGSLSRLARWPSASQRRTRRLVAVALVVAVLLELIPVTGGLPHGAWSAELHLAWREIATGLTNSVVMTAGTLVGTLVLAVPAAYVIARCHFRGRSVLFGLVLLAMAVPGALTLFPEAQALVGIGLIDTRLGVILIYIAANLPLAIFFLRGAIAAVPEPLVEAMRLDGASSAWILVRLILPLTASTLVAVGLLTVLLAWTDALVMIVMTDNQALYTLPVLMAEGLGGTSALGASFLSIGPPLLLFLVFQRRLRRGLAPGGLL